MKKTVQRLRLNRETLRVLTSQEVAQAQGGGTVDPVTATSDLQNSCGSVCYTDKGCGA
jgi:hypothetical protein